REVEQRVEVLWRELDGASPVRERLVLTPRPRRDHAEAVLRPRRPWIERRRFLERFARRGEVAALQLRGPDVLVGLYVVRVVLQEAPERRERFLDTSRAGERDPQRIGRFSIRRRAGDDGSEQRDRVRRTARFGEVRPELRRQAGLHGVVSERALERRDRARGIAVLPVQQRPIPIAD